MDNENYVTTECVATGGRPQETLKWYINDVEQTSGVVVTNPTEPIEPGLSNTRSVLTLTTRDNIGQTLSCRVKGHTVAYLNQEVNETITDEWFTDPWIAAAFRRFKITGISLIVVSCLLLIAIIALIIAINKIIKQRRYISRSSPMLNWVFRKGPADPGEIGACGPQGDLADPLEYQELILPAQVKKTRKKKGPAHPDEIGARGPHGNLADPLESQELLPPAQVKKARKNSQKFPLRSESEPSERPTGRPLPPPPPGNSTEMTISPVAPQQQNRNDKSDVNGACGLNEVPNDRVHEVYANSTSNITIHEIKLGLNVTNQDRTLPLYKRNNTRSLMLDTTGTLAPYRIFGRVGPKFPHGAVFTPPNINSEIYSKCIQEYRMWSLARVVGSSGQKQLLPGFGGFISATGAQPSQKSTIGYFTPISQPFAEYSVIKELLRQSEEATDEVCQEYVLNTFDLGGCMKALPLMWKFPVDYNQHIVTPGSFHTGMNYIGMLTSHKCRGSGYSDILIEAELITSGCLGSVLKGKAYAKALFCLKTVSEAMERLLIERFTQEQKVKVNNHKALLNLVQTCTRENLDFALQDPSTRTILEKYAAYEDKVRAGHLGKTATFWLSVIDHTRLILMLLYSVQTNNFVLFHKCNGDMANLFFAYDGPNYSRYLTWFDVFLTNIDLSHPGAKELLKNGGIPVARSFIPGALTAVDKTMEETFMKFAKSAGGCLVLFSMFGAYQRWCQSTSTRAQYFENMLEMCGLIADLDYPKDGKHRELERAEIKRSEEAVQRTISAIRNFNNPFSLVDKDHLYSLASGAPASPEVEFDVLRAEAVGKEAKEAFIRDRLVNGSEALFFEPIKKQNLKTMEASNKTVKLTTSQGKVIHYREQSDLAFMLLIKSQNITESLNLDELMRYSLTPVPHSLGTPDGFFNKTNKAAMIHFLMDDAYENMHYPKDALYIQDGNALFHALTNLPPTFGEICLQVLDQMVAKKNFVFSTDSYRADSIKAQERKRRGFSQQYILEGPATRKPSDFRLFLANDENQTQLCQLLLRVWGSKAAASRLEKSGTAVAVFEGKAYQLDSSDGNVTVREIPELLSNQEETDTRVVLYLKYAVQLGYKSAVVRTPNADIFLILLHHAHSIALTIFLDTGTGKHRQIINVSELAEAEGADYCTTILGLHVFTGEDVTSAFKGKGKVGPLKKLQSHPRYQQAFRKLGDEWSVEPEVINDIEAFTCLMYDQAREKSVNVVRGIMLRQMVGEDEQLTTKSKVDFFWLPPCRDNLIPHIERVNHRLAIFKRADQPNFWCPNPFDPGQGWEKTDDGILEPVWSSGPILPPSLVDLVETTAKEMEQGKEDDEGDIDFELFNDDD